jgi:uncharacterized RDD family membrane protein YckC
MRCPKCGYLGFDDHERCKNCGYDFSLVTGDAGGAAPAGRPRATPLAVPPASRTDGPRLRPRTTRPGAAAGEGALDRPLSRTPDSAPLDLPLFDRDGSSPLPPPHRPLGVRRSQPVTPRPRPRPVEEPADVLPLEGETATPAQLPDPLPVPPPGRHVTRTPGPPARLVPRMAAWFVDLSLLLLVDAGTLYFTLRLCGLQPAEWDVLPAWPLAAFFLMLNGGYVVLLTGTLGQTLGKMALRIEVMADGEAVVGLRRAVLRTAAALASLLPAGLGLAWALVGERRALHDRLAGTRVVHVLLS